MKQLRAELIKSILRAKDEDEIEKIILTAIKILRDHMINEFVIALFIDKLVIELGNTEDFNDDVLLIKIRLLHPIGLQWQFG